MATLNTQFVYRPHRIDPDQTIAELIRTTPGALDLLIHVGFTPLADPIVRERFAASVTLRQAAETLPINLERLLVDLEKLSSAVPMAFAKGTG